jgi:hypothetical protein
MPLVSVCKFFSGSWHTTAWKPSAATLEIRKKQMFKHTIMPTKTWISNKTENKKEETKLEKTTNKQMFPNIPNSRENI